MSTFIGVMLAALWIPLMVFAVTIEWLYIMFERLCIKLGGEDYE